MRSDFVFNDSPAYPVLMNPQLQNLISRMLHKDPGARITLPQIEVVKRV
jgi:hypothetical protein